MEKPKVFISHIKEEKELAIILKEEIGNAFLGIPEIFVSSDGESISIGTRWLDEIDSALKDAQIMLLICSKESVKRPWVNFEAGAGWIKGIPVIPVCHTDLSPVELPIPLNMLQGINAKDQEGLKKVFDIVARQLDVKTTPKVEFDEIVSQIEAFEVKYGLINKVQFHVTSILESEPKLSPVFSEEPEWQVSGYMTDITRDKITPHLNALKDLNLLEYNFNGNAAISGNGIQLQFTLVITEEYKNISSQINR